MSDTVIRVENVSKLYRLGEVGTGSLAHDVNRWWHRVRGKEDPYLKIGEVNDRTKSMSSVQSPESSAKNANTLDLSRSSLDSTPSSSSRPLDPGLSTPSSEALDSRPSTLVSAPKAQSDWVYALKDISFEVKRGEVLGIIGRNGAARKARGGQDYRTAGRRTGGMTPVNQAAGQPLGRLPEAARRGRRRGKARINSTLLKILSRVTTQTEGRIKVRGQIASLLEVGTGFHPELTVPSEVSFALHGPGREPEGWEARRTSNRRLARRVQRRREGANQNIFLNGAILGMRKAEPERRGGAEDGCRRQARRALRVGWSANQIARKFDEIVEFSEIREFIDTPVQSDSSGRACGADV